MEPTGVDPALLKKAGIESSPLECTPLRGGANNRVYKIEFECGSPKVLKHYFSHPGDTRPRLKSEFEFLRYAWDHGVREIPEPLAQDPSGNIALYSCIDGATASKIHSGPAYVDAAISFLLRLNAHRSQGKHLGPASEACFQFPDYVSLVERRLDRLKALPNDSIHLETLHDFMASLLLPKWDACKSALHSYSPRSADPIISPSDFGLHNTMVASDQFVFIDFEYAGWDDPAKTICDFFLQPKFPVSMDFFDSFSRALASLTSSPTQTIERAKRLFSISKIKWCCIILNVYSKIGQSRREFAEQPHLLETQLQLAKQYLMDGPHL